MSAQLGEPGALNEPRPGRITATEAAKLANAARAARIIPRGSAREILGLLLRLTRGSFGIERSTRWIAAEIEVDYSTAKRSLDALIAAGLVVVVVTGTGRARSVYRVDVARLRMLLDSSDAAPEIVPDRPNEGGHYAPPEGALRPPGGGITPPLYAGARSLLLPFSFFPLPPATAATSKAEPSPAASRRDPLRWQSQPKPKCRHGLTSCRRCGTNPRATSDAEKRAQASAEAERQIRHLAESRAADAQSRALSVAPPADWRHR